MDIDKKMIFAVSKRKLKCGEKMYKNKKNICITLLFSLIIFILAVSDASTTQRKHIVVIDPAHGGKNTGVKISDNITEKDITLAIALALRKEFEKDSGIEIILTRDSDRDITIEERKNDISKAKPDFFISIHSNAGFGKKASGFEIYYPGFKDNILHRKKQQKISNIKESKIKNLNESIKLAQVLQKNLDKLFPRKGRGVREADLPVLEEINVPAAVVEIGFLTNADERKQLLSPKGQSEIAKTLAKGIKEYF